jgi:hypothetical protein
MVAPGELGVGGLTQRLECHGASIRAAIESMNGARFLHDRLELAGWQVEIADAQKVKGLAPLACKTDRIDASPSTSADAAPASTIAPSPSSRWESRRLRLRSTPAYNIATGLPSSIEDAPSIAPREAFFMAFLTMAFWRQPVAMHGNGFRLFPPVRAICDRLQPQGSIKAP